MLINQFRIATALAVALVGTVSSAALITKDVDYQLGEKTFRGYLAYESTGAERKGGVLVVHQWGGLGEYEKMRARQLADLGYVAFCADIYGKGIRPTSAQDKGKLAGEYKGDRVKFRMHLAAALSQLATNERVDRNRLAAIGYCFGGTGVLELARSGANVKGVVSFHGGLDNPDPESAKNIRGKVLILHGADDPFVPQPQVDAFKKEMNDANKPFDFIAYAGAVHAFSQSDAGNDPKTGAAYNEAADKQSFDAMKKFLSKLIG